MRQVVILILFLLFIAESKAQLSFLDSQNPKVLQDTLDIILMSKIPTVLFFCAFNNTQQKIIEEDRIAYNSFYHQLVKKLKFYQIDTTNLLFVKTGTFYNKSPGACYYDKAKKDSIYVDMSMTECYLLNLDSQFVKRAAKKYQLIYKTTQIPNIIRMDFIGKCPTSKASILDYYEDFIPEALKPRYDTNELLEMVMQKMDKLEHELSVIKKMMEK